MATRRQLRRQLSRETREPFALDYAQGYFRGGAGATVIAPYVQLWPEVDQWNGSWLYVASGDNAGAERRIVAYNNESGEFTVYPPFSYAFELTDDIELHTHNSATAKHEAINEALQGAWPYFFSKPVEELVICEDQHEIVSAFGLPADWRQLINVWLEPAPDLSESYTVATGTASIYQVTLAGTTWTTNELAGKRVGIIDGTGKGQERTISSNTTTAITFATAMSPAPANDSIFVIKDERTEGQWERVLDVWPIVGRELERILLPARLQQLVGYTLRLEGLAIAGLFTGATEEELDALDIEEVPTRYILAMAKKTLGIAETYGIPGSEQSEAGKWGGRWYGQEGIEYWQRQAQQRPLATRWRWMAEATGTTGYDPFSRAL